MATDGSLIFDTRIDQKGFEDGLNKLKSTGTKALKAVGTVAATAGTAIAAMGAYATKTSIDFESAFAGVRKTVDATEKQFAELEKGIRNMTKKMPQSASEIAAVAEAAGQLGIETKNILGFTETMVMLGDATNMTSEQAATALARLANITRMPQSEFDRLGSTIVVLGNNLATTEAEIVEMGLRLAGTATQVGMTEAQILALAGAMSSVGINAEAGGSSLSRVMQKINTEVLSSGRRLQKFAEIAGMSAEEFSKAWRERPQDAILAFVQGLDKINKSGGDVTSTLKDLGINSVQEIDTLLRLAGASEVLADSLELAAEAWEENVALAEEAEQRYRTTESQIAILKNHINDLAISVGDELKESFQDTISVAIDMVNQLSTAFSESGFVGLVNEIGNVLAEIITGIASYAPQFFDSAISLITSFIQGIQENLPQIIDAALDLMDSFIAAIVDLLPQIIELGFELVINLINGIAERLPDLITQAIDMVILIADTIIDNIDSVIKAGIQIIMALVQGIVENLPKLIEEVPRIINSFANAIYDNLPTVLKAGVQIILMLIKGLIQSIPTIVKNIPQIIMAIVNVFTLYNWTQLGKNLMKWLGEGIVNMKGNLLNIGKSIAEGVTNVIKNLFKSGINIGQGLVNNLITGIKGLFGSIVSTASNLASSVIQSIINIFKDAPNIGKSLVQGLWNGIDNMAGWILDKIKGFGQSILNGIKGVFGIRSPSKVMKDEVGIELIRGIAEGIKQETPALRELTKQEMDKLISDYGRYGEEAVKKFAKLSKEEMDKIVQDSKKSGQDIAKAIAKGIEEKTHEITNALDKIRGETIKQLDRLGEATITALKRRYQEEERIQLEALQRQTENIRRETDKRIQEYDRELQAKLRILDDNTNAELKRLQAAIDAINEKTKQEEKELREQEWQNRIAAKEKELIEAESAEERLKIQEELNKLRAERERELILEHRQMQIEALRAEMDRIRQQAAEKRAELEAEYQEKKKNEEAKLDAVITNLEKEMEATKQHYATLLEEEALQAEARKLLLDENNQELIDLLESYNPYWFDAGQSFGQSLLDGLNSMKYSIQQVVDEILGMVSTVDMANARIIQAKKDWHEAHARGDRAGMEEAHRRAEEARKQGGTIGADVPLEGLIRQMQATVAGETARISSSMTAGGTNTYSHTVNHNDYGITQHVIIVNPKGSPSENARQLKKVGRELALGY